MSGRAAPGSAASIRAPSPWPLPLPLRSCWPAPLGRCWRGGLWLAVAWRCRPAGPAAASCRAPLRRPPRRRRLRLRPRRRAWPRRGGPARDPGRPARAHRHLAARRRRRRGAQEVSRRVLGRLKRIPAVPEAALVLDQIASEGRLAAAARTLGTAATRGAQASDALRGRGAALGGARSGAVRGAGTAAGQGA